MLSWIASNISTILIALILAAAVVLIVAGMIKRKKAGKPSCGCDCRSCAMNCSCNSENYDK